jgi:DNA-binding transcriptional ArsR family regulator
MDLLQATRMSRNLKALCDVNRIRILEILVKGEFCVSDLVEQLQIDQPKVSHHLAILRSAGIIRSRREGRHINYSIRPSVYSPPTEPDQDDVFDLGDISVAFRFRAGEMAATAENGEAKPGDHEGELEAGGGN